MQFTRRQFFRTSAAAPLFAAPPQPPNVLFILADDLGYGDLGCYGQKKFATPNIDRMAAEGIRFTQTYAGASVCAPSRCCLMTGRHTGHCRIRGNAARGGRRVPLRPDDITVAEVLKQAGYKTAAIGKWGLGEAGTLGVPNCQGFDEWFGFLNQDHALEYYPTHLWENRSEIFPRGNQGGKHTEYVQDLFTARAVRFLRENSAHPFFLYLAYTIPHADSERSRNTGDGYVVPDYEPYESEPWPRPDKGYAAMIARLDRDVGLILTALKAQGVERNTLVIFSSDNGPAVEGQHTPDFFGSRGPLRAEKGSLYEGGIRVPAIARWPGRIQSGQVSDQVWTFWDILPTAAELAGLDCPEAVDGVSFSGVLLRHESISHRHLYWEQQRQVFQQAVRMGNWKGLRLNGVDGPTELYRLDKDPSESKDISREYPEVVAKIEAVMREAHVESADFPSGM